MHSHGSSWMVSSKGEVCHLSRGAAPAARVPRAGHNLRSSASESQQLLGRLQGTELLKALPGCQRLLNCRAKAVAGCFGAGDSVC